MSRSHEAHRADEYNRVSDSNRLDSTPDTGHLLQEITPDDFRASNARQDAERQRNANHPALPSLEICQTPDENFARNIHGEQFDLNHNGIISRAELEQTFRDPAVRRTNPSASATAFALYDNFNNVARLHDDWFNSDITQADLAALRRSPSNAPAADGINRQISAANRKGLDQVIFIRSQFPAPDGQ